jgi:cell division protein FtsN
MRHVIVGGVLVATALAITFGIAMVLQDMATARQAPSDNYKPPTLNTPVGKPKPGEKARVFMMSRRMNDEISDRNEPSSE